MRRSFLPPLLLACTVPLHAQALRRVSVTPAGVEADKRSELPELSGDGGVVAFVSRATNLVPGDGNGLFDAFVWVRDSGSLRRISRAYDGSEADGPTTRATLSADRRHVLLQSTATNLVSDDDEGFQDLFAYDRVTGATHRMTLTSTGDGVPGDSIHGALSADGRWVAFATDAAGVVPGDGDGTFDVFLRDRDPDGNGVYDEGNGTVALMSKTHAGADTPSPSFFPRLSATGRFLTFHSPGADFVPGDTNGDWDVFLVDRDVDGNGVFDEGNALVERVSVGSGGAQAHGLSRDGKATPDGRYVVFVSRAADLVGGDGNGVDDVLVRDRVADRTVRITESLLGGAPNGESGAGRISDDGRFVAFRSDANDLVPGDANGATDIFVHDRDPDRNGVLDDVPGVTMRVSVDVEGGEAAGTSGWVSLSGDGRWVAFESDAPDLVPDDTNGRKDVFLRDRIELGLEGVAQAGQPVGFRLDHAAGEAGARLQVLVSTSGTSPGTTPFAGTLLPLAFDTWTRWSFERRAVLTGTVGADGSARTGTLAFPGIAPGETLTALGVVWWPATGELRAWTAPLFVDVQ